MELICEWCNNQANEGKENVYWELPDGTKAIEIMGTPAVICRSCDMIYHTDKVTRGIEDQLFIIDITNINKSITYEKLMALPKLLKRNYFDFS